MAAGFVSHSLVVAFIQNAGLLLALVFVFDFVAGRQNPVSTPLRQALAGIAIGVIGVAMLVVAVPFDTGIIFDTRSVLLAVSGLFLGAWPTAIAVAMTAAYRLTLGGAQVTGVAVIVASGLIGITWGQLRRRSLEQVTWTELYLLGIIVHLVMMALMFTMPSGDAIRIVNDLAGPVMFVHPLATVAVGLLFTQRLRHHRAMEQLHQSRHLESVGSLAGGVAHDINNVLAAILSLASAHRKQVAESDPLAKSLDTIVKACIRGRSVVRSLLYFARTDVETSGKVDLNALVRETVELLSTTTLGRVRFTTDFQEPLPTITGDLSALKDAVMNVCMNAIEAVGEGGEVLIGTRSRADGTVQVRVRDTGHGMTDEVRARAVEPFFTTKPVGKGTGLGLSMAFGTVKAHGGAFEIISADGEGTEVVMTFPADQPSVPGTQLDVSPASPKPRPGEGLRVLLVDDDPLIGEAVAALLDLEGHEVTAVTSGADAIARFESGLETDLVVLDMKMPGMGGAETLQRLLAIRPEQIVLLCSGHWDEEIASLTDRPNVDALSKPFTLEELESKLEMLGLKC